MRSIVLSFVLASASPVFADPADFEAELENLIGFSGNKLTPRFAFSNDDFYVGADTRPPSLGGMQIGETPVVSNVVVATTTDGAVAWVAGDIKVGCVPQAGDECTPDIGTPLHATGVLRKAGKGWEWVAWHATETTTAKEQAAFVAKGVGPDALPRSIAGAEAVATLFESTFADPKALVASVSSRKDVVLYGSSLAERVVGGAKVKAKLKAWNLSFKVRDGIQAGLAGTTVAWVAANVNAVSTRKTAKPTPYRVVAVFS